MKTLFSSKDAVQEKLDSIMKSQARKLKLKITEYSKIAKENPESSEYYERKVKVLKEEGEDDESQDT